MRCAARCALRMASFFEHVNLDSRRCGGLRKTRKRLAGVEWGAR